MSATATSRSLDAVLKAAYVAVRAFATRRTACRGSGVSTADGSRNEAACRSITCAIKSRRVVSRIG
eukprot:1566294-Pleurochrysis_carterae.AAC.2